MISDQPEPGPSAKKLTFHKVGENLYRLESSQTYYALLKRGGKQIRRSLHRKEVRRAPHAPVRFEKVLPTLAFGSFRRRRQSSLNQDLSYRRLPNLMTEVGQHPLDSLIVPARILVGQPNDQRSGALHPSWVGLDLVCGSRRTSRRSAHDTMSATPVELLPSLSLASASVRLPWPLPATVAFAHRSTSSASFRTVLERPCFPPTDSR